MQLKALRFFFRDQTWIEGASPPSGLVVKGVRVVGGKQPGGGGRGGGRGEGEQVGFLALLLLLPPPLLPTRSTSTGTISTLREKQVLCVWPCLRVCVRPCLSFLLSPLPYERTSVLSFSFVLCGAGSRREDDGLVALFSC